MIYLQKELIIRSIKIIDLVYITLIFFITGYIIGVLLDDFLYFRFNKNNDKNKINKPKKTKFQLIIEIFIQLTLIVIISYIARNLIELIPFPLDGIIGYQHLLVKELKTGSLFMIFMIMFSYNLQIKLLELRKLFIK